MGYPQLKFKMSQETRFKDKQIQERESADMQRVYRFYAAQACRIFCLTCCIILFLISTAGVSSFSFANEDEKTTALAPRQNEGITTGRKVKPEWRMPAHYPIDGFDGIGQIDSISISEGEIVINDRLYLISSDTLYSTPSDVNASIYLFNTGMNVGFVLDSGKKIQSIWLIEIKRR